MKLLIFHSARLLGTAIALTSLMTVSGTAAAKSDKPLNAAEVEPDGTICRVTADGFNYETDLNCEFNTVRKYDRQGNLKFFHYQDKGELQDGQEAPDRAIVFSYVLGNCDIREVITPSGNYSSSAKCEP